MMGRKMVPLLLICVYVRHVQAYCMSLGKNPSITDAPTIHQINFTSVLVSWEGIVTMKECADQFVVKSGLVSSPSSYQMSDLLSTDTTSLMIHNRTPENEYFYQVIAREDKGWRGVDYNKSPEALFTTSRRKGNLRPDQVPTRPPTTTTVANPVDGPNNQGIGDKSSGLTVTETPVSSVKEGSTGFIQDYLVWIIVGVLAALLLLVGLVYNLRKRKVDKNIELESIHGDDDQSEDHDDEDDSDQDHEHDDDGSVSSDKKHDEYTGEEEEKEKFNAQNTDKQGI